jgi:lipopolysaccharide/colanic/teichoic acid biosynthesis glycosyltransferase
VPTSGDSALMAKIAGAGKEAMKRPGCFSVAIMAKRVVDVGAAAVGLVFLWPLLALIAALVKLDSAGPALYRTEVMGLCGRRFVLLKFRSMVVDAHQILRSHPGLWQEYQTNLKVRNDPRITRLGAFLRRYSLDELPQFFNILTGDLSLVGPRVVTELELARYGDSATQLLSVKPGLTGLWQVSGRHTLPFERRMELDLYYVAHWSLWTDLRIILRTVPAVISAKGAG